MINGDYILIPDLHGEYDKFISVLSNVVEISEEGLIKKNKYTIILLGDYLDKGSYEGQVKIIDFLYKNKDSVEIIIGNHEQKNYQILKGLSQDQSKIKRELSRTFYNNSKDQEVINKFFKLYENHSKKIYEDNNLICTHSPCLIEHIENRSQEMIKYSYNSRKDFNTDREYEIYLYNHFKKICQNKYEKFHFFGHIEMSKVMVNDKQVWLDSTSTDKITICIIENKEKLRFIDSNGDVNNVFYSSSQEDAIDYIVGHSKKK